MSPRDGFGFRYPYLWGAALEAPGEKDYLELDIRIFVGLCNYGPEAYPSVVLQVPADYYLGYLKILREQSVSPDQVEVALTATEQDWCICDINITSGKPGFVPIMSTATVPREQVERFCSAVKEKGFYLFSLGISGERRARPQDFLLFLNSYRYSQRRKAVEMD